MKETIIKGAKALRKRYPFLTIDQAKSIVRWSINYYAGRTMPEIRLQPVYGYCPECKGHGERRLNGNNQCVNGHIYPSKDALTEI